MKTRYGAVILAAVVCLLGACEAQKPGSRAEVVRQEVAALEARGLWREAIDELDALRREPGLSQKEQADALYKMGYMADLYLNSCERALGYYTMAKALSPQATWAEEADKRSVYCLENTGRKDAAQALLNQVTGGTDSPAGGPVVAVIDGRSITWNEVQDALLLSVKPEELKDAERRKRMLQEYVYTLMLAAEGAKKGLDKDQAFTPSAEHSKRQALSALYLRRTLQDQSDPDAQRKLADELIRQHGVRIFNEAIPQP